MLVAICLLSFTLLHANNPFSAYGYNVPVATMSNGNLPEFHDRQEVVEIGNVLFNTKTSKIVGNITPDTSTATLAPHTVSLFLSVDPHAARYYSTSPYVYCNNNPVRLVDPDGRDWYENEQTGSVYYNSAMGKNDAGKGAMAGEDWNHFGKNGMFTQKDGVTGSDVQLVTQNGGDISTSTSGSLTDGSMSTNVTMSMMLEGGGEAESFMGDQGYDKLPTQYTEYSKESEGKYPMGGGRQLSITFGKKVQINEKYGYFKKGATKSRSGTLGNTPGDFNPFLGVERVDRRFTKYTSSKVCNFLDKFASFSNGISGTHDYTNPQVYNSWGEYPNNNSTINNFRIQHGTK